MARMIGNGNSLTRLSKRYIALLMLAIIGIGISATGFIFKYSDIVLIGFCLILGLDVKLTDQLIDDRSMKPFRKYVFPLAIVIPVLMGYLATTHDPVFGMVIGTAIGLLLSGKIDHPAFIMCVIGFIIAMVAFVLLAGVEIAITSVYIVPIAAFGAFGDEFGHERISAKKEGDVPGSVVFFFKHRFLLKCMAILCVITGFAEIIHLAGFLCFDLAYDIIAYTWGPQTDNDHNNNTSNS